MTPENKSKRGRKARDRVDFCQAAYWAWWVRHRLGLDFAKIERLVDPNCYEHREYIGGYMQPQLWRRYALGEISPTGNGRSGKNAVQLAEELCPGSKDVFHSVLWELLRIKNPNETQLRQLSQKLPAIVQTELFRLTQHECSPWEAISKLPKNCLNEVARGSNIDVLAVLLMRLHAEKDILEEIGFVALITWWLNHSVLTGATRSVAYMLLPILEEYQPLLGSLNPFIAITQVLPAQDHWDKAFRHVYFGTHFIDSKA